MLGNDSVRNFNVSFRISVLIHELTVMCRKLRWHNIEKAKTNTTYIQDMNNFDEPFKSLHVEIELHKKKAEWFYREKRTERKHRTRIAIEFGRNLPIPNIATNMYYKRQLSIYLFSVNILPDGSLSFYTCDPDRIVGKKGSDNVVS
ncbi:hypothetical protein PR048_005711, partial [Dryococelus australis]